MIDEKKIQEAAYIWTQDNYGNPVGICAGDIAFAAGAKWVLEQSQWIMVTDSLPNKDDSVLVVVNGKVDHDWFDHEFNHWAKTRESNAIITHWQPLPEPPKQ